MLSTDALEAGLAGCSLAARVQVYRETASTNDLAMRLGGEGAPHGTLVFAEAQTAGRGRLGRRWESAPGLGLWFSLVLRPAFPEALRPRLTLCAAVGAARGIEAAGGGGVPVGVKWPNDLQIGGRKIAGILLESRSGADGFVVAGIGINVNHDVGDFPETLRGIAGSLRLGFGRPFAREEIACGVVRSLETAFAAAEHGFAAIVEECERRSVLLGRAVELRAGEERIAGIATGIDPETGALVLRGDDGGHRRVGFGEVTVIGR